jgi:hypothetical protein
VQEPHQQAFETPLLLEQPLEFDVPVMPMPMPDGG